jgi:hypothetical protein
MELLPPDVRRLRDLTIEPEVYTVRELRKREHKQVE